MAGPSHVELIGLPGSGKTTVADRLGATDSDTFEFRDGYKSAVCQSLFPGGMAQLCRQLPIEVLDILAGATGVKKAPDSAFNETAQRLVERYSTDSDRHETVMGWIRDLATRRATASQLLPPSVTLVYDEGYLMRGNAVFSPAEPTAALNLGDIDTYLRMAPQPDMVVRLEIPLEISAQRIRNRETGPPESMRHQDQSEQRQRLERMKKYVQRACETLSERGVRCVTVRNDELSVAEATAKIRSLLPP